MQPPSPYWVDPAAVTVPPPSQQYHYYAVAPPTAAAPGNHPPAAVTTATQPTSPTVAPPNPGSHPRPRKPYTTTKVREMWSASEHQRMLEGLRLYKRDWAKVTRFVGTRSAAQVRSHAQKYFDRVARDKTDDYVPRARPKRKSATPYPRKAREDALGPSLMSPLASHPPPVSVSTAPMPMPISVPMQHVPHPLPHSHKHAPPQSPQAQHSMAHTLHPAQMHMQLTSRPSMMPHVGSSPAFMAQQHMMSMPQGVPSHMFSPYMTVCPPPQATHDVSRPVVQASPVPHPSPMSYMSGPTYPANSPVSHQPQVQMPPHGHPMYGMFSPVTPGSYPAITRSPAVGQSPMTFVATGHMPPQPQHVPTHSHPGGPSDNCAKCAALQRYGNVLQEISGFHPPAIPASAREGISVPIPGHLGGHVLRHSGGNGAEHGKDLPDNLSGKMGTDESSYMSTDEAPRMDIKGGSAHHRAQRARVMKARKARVKPTPKPVTKSPSPDEADRSSESCDSAAQIRSSVESNKNMNGGGHEGSKTAKEIMHDSIAEKDSNSKFLRQLSRKRNQAHMSATGGENGEPPAKKPKVRRNKCERPSKRIRPANSVCNYGKRRSNEEISVPVGVNDTPRASGCSSPATRVGCDKSEESRGKDSSSPGVKTYSPSERKEIFDAVKSLQILAKNSSSSSPSES